MLSDQSHDSHLEAVDLSTDAEEWINLRSAHLPIDRTAVSHTRKGKAPLTHQSSAQVGASHLLTRGVEVLTLH
jgi:hypothetical protein